MYDFFYHNIKRDNKNFTHNQITYIYDCMSVGYFQFVSGWVENGMIEPPEQMEQLMDNTLKGC